MLVIRLNWEEKFQNSQMVFFLRKNGLIALCFIYQKNIIWSKLLPQRPAARVLFWGSFGRRGHPAAGTTVRCGSVWAPTALACVSSLNLRMQCSSKHTQSNESHFGSSHKYVQIHFPTHLQQIERFPQFYETKNYIELCLVTLCVSNLPKNYVLFCKTNVT